MNSISKPKRKIQRNFAPMYFNSISDFCPTQIRNPTMKQKDGRRNNPGRPPLPESEKQPPRVYEPTGKPRGRPPSGKPPKEPTGNPRGRPKKD